MTSAIPPVSSLAGVWLREFNYEPRDVMADNRILHNSHVYWVQAPDGRYVDMRRVNSEGFKDRGFAGTVAITPIAEDPTAFTLTWERAVDSKPESCPTGIDTATCRVVGDLRNPTAEVVLMEEGEGYLEVWRRIRSWDDSNGTSMTSDDSCLVSPATTTTTAEGGTTEPFTVEIKCHEFLGTVSAGDNATDAKRSIMVTTISTGSQLLLQAAV